MASACRYVSLMTLASTINNQTGCWSSGPETRIWVIVWWELIRQRIQIISLLIKSRAWTGLQADGLNRKYSILHFLPRLWLAPIFLTPHLSASCQSPDPDRILFSRTGHLYRIWRRLQITNHIMTQTYSWYRYYTCFYIIRALERENCLGLFLTCAIFWQSILSKISYWESDWTLILIISAVKGSDSL